MRPPLPQEVVAKDGVVGLFGRGLKTKIVANGLQVGVRGWAAVVGDAASMHGCCCCLGHALVTSFQ